MKTSEKKWVTEAGYEAEVIATPMGHRCGYVTVPKDHPHYGKGYDDIDADVHGGLTYANEGTFGFDCAHYNDARDVSIMSDEYKNILLMWPSFADGETTIKTLEFCIAECESLAKQFKEMSC